MGAPSGTLSAPDKDADLIARAVGDLARRTRFPVAFGGLERDGAVHVSAVVGARTHHLDSLVVEAGRGLGGRALVETRPRLALDYRTAKGITHDYDGMVLGEGIATLFAVPVVSDGRARAVIYCGSWGQAPVSDVTAKPAFDVAENLATELRIRDEVERRIARTTPAAGEPTMAPAVREELRSSFAELRSISADVRDAELRDRLGRLERRLAALSHDGPSVALDVTLSPREIDVLACAALGATNAEIGASLVLKEVTVKSYLASAMAKLDVSTRHAAVATARRAGLLP
ncbi:LuxR C-terminal-related transcriptional regulator [Microbacterium sp.]|uniref:LuxR C-terminal-related transcriptional regulator n=1 Tax=Microbacterium sp. TaxID=51671 RepID=UPI0025E7F50C|nr:LuxR C-terminal-related transcriptional regulator [Microbacterium sp.]